MGVPRGTRPVGGRDGDCAGTMPSFVDLLMQDLVGDERRPPLLLDCRQFGQKARGMNDVAQAIV